MDSLRKFISRTTKSTKDIDRKEEMVLNRYYKYVYFRPYFNTRNKLIQMVIKNDFPEAEEWNQLADEEGYFSSVSIKYIEGCNWKQLKKKLLNEVKEFIKEL